jgi:hypothetical protein
VTALAATARTSRLSATFASHAMRHPEWPVLVLAAAAWIAIIVRAPGGPAVDWLLMTSAMMMPIAGRRIRSVVLACEPPVRVLAGATTLAGFLVAWMLAGAVVVGATAALPALTFGANPLGFVAVWWLAALWQLTPARARALERCHRVRMARRRRARQWLPGLDYGRWCVAACGPAMAAMAVTDTPLLVMAGMTVALVAERSAFRPRRVTRVIALAMPAWALTAAVLTMLGVGGPGHATH